jgi:hypothetical protein
MSIVITSSTDSDADVQSAQGNQQKIGDKPAPPEVVLQETKSPATASEAVEGEAEGKAPAEPKSPEEKPTTNLDKRFAKLTRQREEAKAIADDAKRQAAYWENEAKKYRDSTKPPEAKVETVPAAVTQTGEPKQEDFETYQKYVEARMDWKFEQAETARERKANEAATKAAIDNTWKSYQQKEVAFIKDNPDYQARVDAIKEAGIKFSPIVESRIIEAGSPELAYELMKDADEFRALNQMNPNDALEHIGVVKAQLRAKSSGTASKVPEIKQPKPVSPVGSKVTAIKDPEKMSVKEYDAWRRAGNSPTG